MVELDCRMELAECCTRLFEQRRSFEKSVGDRAVDVLVESPPIQRRTLGNRAGRQYLWHVNRCVLANELNDLGFDNVPGPDVRPAALTDCLPRFAIEFEDVGVGDCTLRWDSTPLDATPESRLDTGTHLVREFVHTLVV